MPACLIGLGSNQGDRLSLLDAAVAELRGHPSIAVAAVSSWHETKPVGGPPGQSPFLNGALRVETSLEPHALLAFLRQIEDRLGRRRAARWAARTIDLDLLFYDELVLDSPTLTLPHPRMAWRRFVLEPAAEVAGDMLHPKIRWSIEQLLEHLNRSAPYIAITGPIGAGKTWLAERLGETIPARVILERPDWAGLEAFYADPPGHAWSIELGFLRQRTDDLAAMATDASGPPAWTVSDFWFDQSAAFARAWLNDEQWPAFFERYEALRQSVVRPRLIVHLDAPVEALSARVRDRGRACERPLTERQLDRIAQAIRAQTSQPELGPILYADGDDLEGAFSEVLAAARGME